MIVKKIKNILKSIHFFYIRFMLSLGSFMVRVEEETFEDENPIVSTINQNKKEFKRFKKTHLNNLRNQVFDADYYQYFYQIMRLADEYRMNSNPFKIQNDMAMKLGTIEEGRYKGNEGGRKNKNKTLKQIITEEYKQRFNISDEHEVVHFIDNKVKQLGMSSFAKEAVEEVETVDSDGNIQKLERLKEKIVFNRKSGNVSIENKYVPMDKKLFKIETFRTDEINRSKEDIPINKLDQLAEFLIVVQHSTSQYRLDFYVPKKFNLSNFIPNVQNPEEMLEVVQSEPLYKKFREVLDFDYITFIDDYDKYFSYFKEQFIGVDLRSNPTHIKISFRATKAQTYNYFE